MYQVIVFLPLLGFLIAGLFGRMIGARASELVTTTLLFIAAFFAWIVFFRTTFGGEDGTVELFTWMSTGGLDVTWAIRVDSLTAVMLILVTTVSALVHLYSMGYMHEDPSRPRFFAYLSLFTFAMLTLVTSDNLVQLFFGWEGVGLASYLLIGFWYDKPSACAAAMKAFIVNRVGDFGFALGIFAVFMMTGSVAFEQVFASAPSLVDKNILFLGHEWHAPTIICLLLFVGAMGKSAQLGLHTWLPDAMEGPTPVSALIHAATMVTAGVFMVARLSPLFELSQTALNVVLFVGASTAFFAATIGCVQNDIKRVIAYSTCSQLGYMFTALGTGAYSVGVFHLLTHGFFKALLFLAAGSVITAMHHEQDMRHMGGLWRKIPFTYGTMMIGGLALTGFPFTAGYYSKDAIIETAFVSSSPFATYAWVLTVAAAALTAFYTWRQMFMTFHGETRADHHTYDHVHESPKTMLIPLGVLSLGALFAGMILYPYFVGHDVDQFFREAIFMGPENKILEEMHHIPGWAKWAPTAMMALGFLTAYWMYIANPAVPKALAKQNDVLYRFLLNKWYFDEIYDFLFVRTTKWLGNFLWKQGDIRVIDGYGPNGVSARVVDVTNRVIRLQTGYLYHYAFVMLVGVAALITWFMFGGAH
ncbi:NADH-quinone oxidoreductase subunit L [Ancylobacter sp. MQZ15Z-1]|uniref:NADH-quinone oxidoreductase subunit L n=1 Tax=Ancylobacter mangrovi TaxID=2972472 RepID=A0A9X2PFI6_9HYPH|nr:NADH-quinone oxidoreductase subunit L [Ancylobacter mangrovi]MCS0497817.1 NADH-quinone oxidoreductase subunit L [Ancylobacter mangrovi]